jgi:hypothetical protein
VLIRSLHLIKYHPPGVHRGEPKYPTPSGKRLANRPGSAPSAGRYAGRVPAGGPTRRGWEVDKDPVEHTAVAGFRFPRGSNFESVKEKRGGRSESADPDPGVGGRKRPKTANDNSSGVGAKSVQSAGVWGRPGDPGPARRQAELEKEGGDSRSIDMAALKRKAQFNKELQERKEMYRPGLQDICKQISTKQFTKASKYGKIDEGINPVGGQGGVNKSTFLTSGPPGPPPA